ncbi:cral trio domain-containing protein [Cyclospora cayetanensis]|uniref:Cral trio domain-containing protein n=1 Tax=Cyclospora cayetanensis TaxID=88456 RepID=A0A1D3CV54_9EIME|nr:cral trio domain-containing protein [Cyclospora cayetanensis]
MALVESEAPSTANPETFKRGDTLTDSESWLATSCSSPAFTGTSCVYTGPPPSLYPAPPIEALKALELTEEQLAKIKALRASVDALPIVTDLTETPQIQKEKSWLSGLFSRSSSSISKGEVTALTWEEVLWLANDMVLCRYLRSYSWDDVHARQQLLRTVWWRRHRKPHCISPEEVKGTAARGSVYRKGFDKRGHPIVYFKPGREPAQSTKAAQDYTLYTMERAMQSVDKSSGRDQLVFLVDFSGFSITQVPSMDLSKEVVGILNDHYTDILAKAYMLDAPSYFDSVWRFVKIMLHPLTASKVEFIQTSNKQQLSKLLEHVPAEFLEESLGGTCEVSYDHDRYWEAEDKYHAEIKRHMEQEIQKMRSSEVFLARLNTASRDADSQESLPTTENESNA